jgi:hypothetical protein
MKIPGLFLFDNSYSAAYILIYPGKIWSAKEIRLMCFFRVLGKGVQ